MNNSHLTRNLFGAATLILACAQLPAAAQAKSPFSASITAGGNYDSNVSVAQTDLLTRQGDAAALLGANAQYDLIASKDGSLHVGYAFDQTLHAKLTSFDMQTHDLSVGGSVKVGGATLGADYSFFHILLGGQRFLDMHYLSPSIGGLVGKSLYLRASYTYMRKDFVVATERNANNNQGALDAYYFFMGNKAYVSIGGNYEREKTVDPIYVYKGFKLGAKVQLPVQLFGAQSKLKLGYSYRKRNYDNVTPSIGERRHENRSVFDASADIPLTRKLSLLPAFRYVDRNSNYAFSNYVETIATASLRYRF